jgi:oxygen-independent coproporphyrinogen-3 oxidase
MIEEKNPLEFTLTAPQLNVNGKQVVATREEFYTNYPFFKYWRSEFNSKLFSLPGINIYIHIPYCIQICDYCFYNKELIRSKEQVDEYISYLCKEIALLSERLSLKRRPVNSVYIGGGTPSVLSEKQFKTLVSCLHQHHTIENPEFTFEAEPGTFSKSKLQWYKESGINRISMGVQSFDDEVIRLSSRKHTSAQAINSIDMVKDIGGFSVNIDLLSGLAGETLTTWGKSVDTALQQPIDLLTIYKMKSYANTTFFKEGVHKNNIQLPSETEEIEFMWRAYNKLKDAGYKRWSTFAYTKNETIHSYAENTWRGQDLVAYGVSSFGKLGNLNYQNLNATKLYYERIDKNEIPIQRSYHLSMKDQITKELLLCNARLTSYKKSEFYQKFGFDYFNLIPEVIEELVSKDFITKETNELVLTDRGVVFGDFVSRVLAESVKDALGKDSIGFVY